MEYLFLEKKVIFLQFNFIFLQFNFILLIRTKGTDMKKMLCLAVFALGLATPAVAADWVRVDINNDNTTFGDADSRTDNRAWFEHRYAKPQKIGDGKFFNTTKTLRERDCSGKRHRLLTVTAYSKSGKPIDSETPSYPKWDYVIPGTAGESAYKFVCNHDPR